MMSMSRIGKSTGATTILVVAAATTILVLLAAGLNGALSRFSFATPIAETSRNLGRQLFQEEIPKDVIETMDPKMVDFVVGGFQKCGTTYLQNKILYPSKRLFIPHHETHFLQNDKYAQFVTEFENVTTYAADDNSPILAGYKSPFELGHHRSLRNLETLFPDIQMIITLRHPVLQFESLYNYKLRESPEPLPPVEEFVGVCGERCPRVENEHEEGRMNTLASIKRGQKCLTDMHWCTGESNYHQYLSRLGLTPMNTPEELDLLDHHQMSIHDFSGTRGRNNKIRGASGNGNQNRGRLFLIEIGQFDNRVNQSMADDVNADLETFLGLDLGDLPRAPPRSGDTKPKEKYKYPPGYEEHRLNICLDRYKPLRDILLQTSRKSAKWIMEYLLHPSNRHRVIVSNIDTFEEMLENWKVDPCLHEDEDPE